MSLKVSYVNGWVPDTAVFRDGPSVKWLDQEALTSSMNPSIDGFGSGRNCRRWGLVGGSR